MREETGVISDCERDKVVLRNGGVSRFGIVYSLDYGRLMGVPYYWSPIIEGQDKKDQPRSGRG
mgnify:CR=1 FL=1